MVQCNLQTECHCDVHCWEMTTKATVKGKTDYMKWNTTRNRK